MSWDKAGDWMGGSFGVLGCASHRFPAVWEIPIFLSRPPVGFSLALIEQGRFRESLELALATSVPKTRGSFTQRRSWARQILPDRSSSFKQALSILPKSWREFFGGRLSDPDFHRIVASARGVPHSRGTARRAPASILDLGCGTAPLAYRLSRLREHMRVISLDINFYLLYFGRRFFTTDSLYVFSDAHERFPFRSRSFGTIVCSGVSEAIRNLKPLVSECERVLNPKGFLLFKS